MSDEIRLSNAEFFFTAEPGELPREFVTTDRQRRLAGGFDSDLTRGFHQSLGAHVSGWMETPEATPAGVFARVFLSRLEKESDIEAILNGLHEIARIEGQGWASEMAASLEALSMLWRSQSLPNS